MNRTYRFLISIFFVVMCFLLAFQETAQAKGQIEVEVETGFNGKIQPFKGFPVSVTLTNNGDDISGDLSILAAPNHESAGNLVIPVELAAGATKTIDLTIPGLSEHILYNNNTSMEHIYFYKGGWESGTEVELEGDTRLSPAIIYENKLVIGVLSDTPDRLNFLKLVQFNAEAPEVITIDPKQIPDQAEGLEVLDVLVVNTFNAAELSDEQLSSIKKWVQKGGKLLVGSEPGMNQKLGELSSLLPISVTGEVTVNELTEIESEVNTPLKFGSLELVTGEVTQNSSVLYQEGEQPIVVSGSSGFGSVTQFAFNIGANQLVDWEGYGKWWSSLLSKMVQKNMQGMPFMDRFYDIRVLSELFPTTNVPLQVLSLFFLLYLIILIPVLYIVLKRWDKREWAWWIVPALAVVCSLGIFFTGAKDRIGGTQGIEANMIALHGDGTASGFGVSSFLANSGGNYTIQTNNSIQPFPMTRRYVNPDDPYNDWPLLERDQNSSEVTFRDVEYWSVRSVMGDLYLEDIGSLQSDLQLKTDQITGTIQNTLPFDLLEVHLLTGFESYEIGSVPAGESKEVSLDVGENKILGGPSAQAASKLYPNAVNPRRLGPYPQGKADNAAWKKATLIRTALEAYSQTASFNNPLLIGFTDKSITDMKVDNKKLDKNYISNLVFQEVPVNVVNQEGQFTIPGAVIEPSFSVVEGRIHHNGMEHGEPFLDVAPGKYEFLYELPNTIKAEKMKLNKVSVHIREQFPAVTLEIYNDSKGGYEPLSDTSLNYYFEENAGHYLAADNTIKLRISKTSSNGDGRIPVPSVSLEGEFIND